MENIKFKSLEFEFRTWSEEITNNEFSNPLGKRLKLINEEININAKDNIFTIKYPECFEYQILKEIEDYSGPFWTIFKNSIKFII
jgi:hypothetical protein